MAKATTEPATAPGEPAIIEPEAQATTEPATAPEESPVPLVVTPVDAIRMQQRAAALEALQAPDPVPDVPGGRYLVGDQWVNANGEPIQED